MMTKAKRFFSNALASLMLAGLCLCFATSVSNAQCPTDIPPTSGPGTTWSGPFSADLSIASGCVITYHWCQRTINGEIQRYIEDFGPTPGNWGSGCDAVWKNVLDAIREYLFQTAPTSDCDPGNVKTVVSVFNGSCAQMQIPTGGSYPVCYMCGGAYCKKKCELCKDANGHNQETNCELTVINTADCDAISSWSTLTVSDVSTNSWGYNLNQCYLIGCDSNP